MDELYVVIFYDIHGNIVNEIEVYSLMDAMKLRQDNVLHCEIENVKGVVINDV